MSKFFKAFVSIIVLGAMSGVFAGVFWLVFDSIVNLSHIK